VVWNYEIFGYDSLYMGQLGHCRKVAYAPSCGQVSYDQSHPDNMANDLVNFDSLSARDTNTQKMLKHLIGRNAPLVLDPTLIYDFCAETAKTSRKISNPYLLAYAYNYPYGNLSQVEEYATQNGLDVLGVGYHESFGKSFCSSFLSGVGPFEWIQLFQAAHTILTSTFHGVIFSLKSRKPFFYITNKRAFNRVKSLLDTAGIDNSIHAEDEGKILYFNPDYDQVEAHFKPLIDFSRKWLLESVSL
jgi:hypothetical protein